MEEAHPDVEKVLISESSIEKRVKALGEQISNDYKDSKGLIIVGVLHGAFLFTADLAREIKDVNVRVDFMSVSSYGSGVTSSGAVKIIMDMKESIEGKDVLIVEDVIDSGLTLKYLTDLLSARLPSSLRLCVLLQKSGGQSVAVKTDYVGFHVPKDAFVIGYGLDYAGSYRCLPYVGILKKDVYA